MKSLRVGLLGLGQIGTGVYQLLTSKPKSIFLKSNVCLELSKIAEKNSARVRQVRPKGVSVTGDAFSVLRDPSLDVVVELIGGIHPAKEFILEAFRNGKDVVTANKALLAEEGEDIFRAAKRYQRHIYFEASVGGGIPIIKSLREGLIANDFDSIQCIINGTSNYILSKMSEEKLDFKSALKLAQEKGYAEADPTLDIEGTDAAHKIAIMAGLVFGGWIKFKDVYHSGISNIGSDDIAFANEFGYVVKLLAIAKKVKEQIEVRVEPVLLPKTHILANVNGSFNAVLMNGDQVGDVLLYGRGAGRNPTASAILSDLVDLGRVRLGQASLPLPQFKKLKTCNVSLLSSRYYLRVQVVDQPGVLSKISHILGSSKISISDVIQRERRHGSVVPLILLTHETLGHKIHHATKLINRLSIVKGKVQVIKIES